MPYVKKKAHDAQELTVLWLAEIGEKEYAKAAFWRTTFVTYFVLTIVLNYAGVV